MILGLDISTSITGVTLLDLNNKIILNNSIDLRKHKNFFVKSEKVAEYFSNLSKKPDSVFIEQSLQSFRSGFSSATTLSLLSRFNGVVSWLAFKEWGLEPQYIAATSARKLAGIKITKGTPAKQQVLQHLLDTEPSFVVEYTRHGNPKPDTYDRADSLIIARAGLEICTKEKN
tara:strand:+ start:925 stop:1443 length:519 start_codon:yes stop_codon:yes gene_type:complete